MVTGYRDFHYYVTDLERAVRFYVQVFGMTKSYGNEHWSTLNLGNLQLGLHKTHEESVPSTPRDSHGQLCGGTLTLLSDNVKEDRLKIEAHGGKILGEAEEPWGHMLAFEYLDGNVLKLMKPRQ